MSSDWGAAGQGDAFPGDEAGITCLDYLNLTENPKVRKTLDEGETVVFSDHVTKINRRGKEQLRALLITDHAVYNMDPKKFACKRKIHIQNLGLIISSQSSDEFILRVPAEYDYHLRSSKQEKVIMQLKKLYKYLAGKHNWQRRSLEHKWMMGSLKDTVVTKLKTQAVQAYRATLAGDDKQLNTYISKGADINEAYYGKTLLHEAAIRNHLRVCTLLVAKRATVDAKDNLGQTPLHLASAGGFHDIVRLLLKAKASIQSTDINRRTPCHNCSEGGYDAVLKTILLALADPNAVDTEGQSPMHLAVVRGLPQTVRVLLQARANTSLIDTFGATPRAWARFAGHKQILHFLDNKDLVLVTRWRVVTKHGINSRRDPNPLSPTQGHFDHGVCIDVKEQRGVWVLSNNGWLMTSADKNSVFLRPAETGYYDASTIMRKKSRSARRRSFGSFDGASGLRSMSGKKGGVTPAASDMYSSGDLVMLRFRERHLMSKWCSATVVDTNPSSRTYTLRLNPDPVNTFEVREATLLTSVPADYVTEPNAKIKASHKLSIKSDAMAKNEGPSRSSPALRSAGVGDMFDGRPDIRRVRSDRVWSTDSESKAGTLGYRGRGRTSSVDSAIGGSGNYGRLRRGMQVSNSDRQASLAPVTEAPSAAISGEIKPVSSDEDSDVPPPPPPDAEEKVDDDVIPPPPPEHGSDDDPDTDETPPPPAAPTDEWSSPSRSNPSNQSTKPRRYTDEVRRRFGSMRKVSEAYHIDEISGARRSGSESDSSSAEEPPPPIVEEVTSSDEKPCDLHGAGRNFMGRSRDVSSAGSSTPKAEDEKTDEKTDGKTDDKYIILLENATFQGLGNSLCPYVEMWIDFVYRDEKRPKEIRKEFFGARTRWPEKKRTSHPIWRTPRGIWRVPRDTGFLKIEVFNHVSDLATKSGHGELIGKVHIPLKELKIGVKIERAVRMVAKKATGFLSIRRLPMPPKRKFVFFVRHGQSVWNAAKKEKHYVSMLKQTDHPLTQEGKIQAELMAQAIDEVKDEIDQWRSGHGDAKATNARMRLLSEFLNAEAVISSPLCRAVQTAVIGLSTHPNIRTGGTKVQLRSDVREKRNFGGRDTTSKSQGKHIVERVIRKCAKLYKSVKGDPRSQRIKNMIDIGDAWDTWWNTEAETKKDLATRIRRLSLHLKNIPAQRIVLVGHSHFFRRIIGGHTSIEFKERAPKLTQNLLVGKLDHCAPAGTVMQFDDDGEGLPKVEEFAFLFKKGKFLFDKNHRSKTRDGGVDEKKQTWIEFFCDVLEQSEDDAQLVYGDPGAAGLSSPTTDFVLRETGLT